MAQTLSCPIKQSAIVADQQGNLVISHDVPLPELRPDMLLVKTAAVALNPVDVKLTGPLATDGAVAGSDCAGTVVALGSDVSTSRFRIGDRVCAAIAPMNPAAPRAGAFAQFAAAVADCTLKIPDSMSFESAATLGVSIATIGYALFRSLEIPGHPEKPANQQEHPYVLVYGGSTASGTMAIQLIRMSGLVPIATCSPKNFRLVQEYGAEKAFDYHDEDNARCIREYTKNALTYALDCICERSSMKFCYAAIGRGGGKYTTLEPYPENGHTRNRVLPDWIMGPALLGMNIPWMEPYYVRANPELRVFGREWFMCAQRLLDQGLIHPHPARVGVTHGFEDVLRGLAVLKEKTVSGEKLVYRVHDL